MTKTKRPNIRSNRYKVGERVYLKRRQNGRWRAGVIQRLIKDSVAERAVLLAMSGGGERIELTSDICRTPPTPTTPWVETERQGGGRRYWFRSFSAMCAFARAKKNAGYHIALDNDSVWVSNGKRVTDEIRNQQAGKEVERGN